MKYIRILAAALMMLIAVGASAEDFPDASGSAAPPAYQMLNPPQPVKNHKKIEVLEFFFYGCIHCFHLHPELAKWVKTKPRDVSIDYVPVAFRPSWAPMAYTYYTLKEMGKGGKLDDQLYDALNVDGLALNDGNAIADFVSHYGISRKKFLEYYNSFTVRADVERARQMMVDYQIEGTPTLVVNGKYAVVNTMEPQGIIANLNKTIAVARKARRMHRK